MPITAQDIFVLHTYAVGVMQRADHHAGKVRGAALAIIGGIIWRGDPGSIKIRQYAGSPANMLCVSIGGNAYVIKYDHDTMQIQICDRTQSGAVLHSLDGTTPVSAGVAVRAVLIGRGLLRTAQSLGNFLWSSTSLTRLNIPRSP